MRFLFVSEDLIAGNLSRLLVTEGHEVKLCILKEEQKQNFDGLVQKTDNWENELSWVGKEGVVVFDYTGDGKVQDRLRAEGYAVFGGGEKGEALEIEREFAQNLFTQHGMDAAPVYDFSDLNEAIAFIRNNPAPWVIKKNDVATNSVSYIGVLDDGSDVIDVLNSYNIYNKDNCDKITLQRKIDGVEIAVARFFNGNEWVSPIEVNIEHNPFLSGDIGLSTSEMGTICWHARNEKNRLFQKTLKKLEPYLKEINYRGVIDINCIVNKEGIFPLEATTRFGSPISHLQSEMLNSGWGNLIAACAKGMPHRSVWKKGFGIVVFVTAPPFPYAKKLREYNPKGQRVYFANVSDTEMQHIHFEDISYDAVNNAHIISDTRGYILYVTACEVSARRAQKKCYKRIQGVFFPKMMYRNDIGKKFIERERRLLKKWGYL